MCRHLHIYFDKFGFPLDSCLSVFFLFVLFSFIILGFIFTPTAAFSECPPWERRTQGQGPIAETWNRVDEEQEHRGGATGLHAATLLGTNAGEMSLVPLHSYFKVVCFPRK